MRTPRLALIKQERHYQIVQILPIAPGGPAAAALDFKAARLIEPDGVRIADEDVEFDARYHTTGPRPIDGICHQPPADAAAAVPPALG